MVFKKILKGFTLHAVGDLWDPSNRFETSWFISPYVLFAIRAIFSIYCFSTLLIIIAHECSSNNSCTSAGDNFSYFTTLTYWGLAFYFFIASMHTFTYARTGRAFIDIFPRFFKACHSFFYTTIVILPLLVTVVYWVLLFELPWYKSSFRAWSNISQHALNSFFALFEILATRTAPPPWAHLLWLSVLMALYVALAYVTNQTKGFFPYTFLDPDEKGSGGVTAYVMGIWAAIIVVYLLVRGLIWVRMWLTERKMKMEGKFTKQRGWRPDQELGRGQMEK